MVSSVGQLLESVAQSLQAIRTLAPLPNKAGVMLALLISVPFLLHSYHDVAITMASSQIKEEWNLTPNQLHSYVLLLNKLPHIGGALTAAFSANFYGRRYTAALGGGICTVGALVTCFTRSYAASVFGRILTGFGTGMGLLVAPIYIAEFVPARVRGSLGSCPQVMMAAGMMLAYALESALVSLHPRTVWRVIIGVAALPSAVFTIVILLCVPDTPCWLVMLGRVNYADNLLRFYGADMDEAYERMRQLRSIAGIEYRLEADLVPGAPGRIAGSWGVLKDIMFEPIFRNLITATGLLVTQEATFDTLVFQFVMVALGRNRVSSRLAFSTGRLLLSCIKLLSTLLSSPLGNAPGGRKALLLVSMALAGCSLGGLGGTILADAHGRVHRGTAFGLYILELLVLEVAIGAGLGPIPWMYGPEVFPLALRAPFLGLCITTKVLAGLIFEMILYPLVDTSLEGCGVRFLVSCGLTTVLFLCCTFVTDRTGQILMDEAD